MAILEALLRRFLNIVLEAEILGFLRVTEGSNQVPKNEQKSQVFDPYLGRKSEIASIVPLI